MQNQEELVALKARLFDAEEAFKVSEGNFNHLVAYLIENLELTATNMDEFIQQLQEKIGKKVEEVVVEEVEEAPKKAKK